MTDLSGSISWLAGPDRAEVRCLRSANTGPPPSDAPRLEIVSKTGNSVRLWLDDSPNSTRSGKPAGVTGAAVQDQLGVCRAHAWCAPSAGRCDILDAIVNQMPTTDEYPFQRAIADWRAPSDENAFTAGEIGRIRNCAGSLIIGLRRIFDALESLFP